MKKLTAFLLSLVLAISMAACAAPSQSGETTAPTEPEVSTAPSTEPTVTEPPVTEPPVTEPPVTEPPETEPPVTEPPMPHEKFNAKACKRLFGTWKTTVTLDRNILHFDTFTGKTTFQLYYTFTEDGQFTAWADETEFKNAISTYEDLLVDYMVQQRYIEFRGQMEWNGTLDETIINEQWAAGPEAQARADCEAFIPTLNLYYHCSDLLRSGQYYVEDGKLYTQLADESFESSAYSAGSTNLVLTNTSNPGVYSPLNLRFPLRFKVVE